MATKVYKYDKELGEVVDVTPEEDRAICAELERDVKAVQRKCKDRKVIATLPKWNYPSEAMAIDPVDIPRAQKILQRAGVYTEYTPTGEPIMRSREHRKAHAEAMGFYDRNGGYGDPQPRNR